MTFSIVARCTRTGQVGVAVSSSSPAVAARCAHVRAGAGAAASQNITDPRLGTSALDHMQDGLTAAEALARIREQAGDTVEYRQLALVDDKGRVAAFSGQHTLGVHAVAEGPDVVAAGNLLAGSQIPDAMLASFAKTGADELGDRLIAALIAGLEAGGEAGPVHSAGMLIADREAWPMTDLRVDWSENPIHELADIWSVWKPQARDYVTRGLDPATSPAYGVPGDE
jgi:uncharacterized Ntn-hydrolase superfamily protein